MVASDRYSEGSPNEPGSPTAAPTTSRRPGDSAHSLSTFTITLTLTITITITITGAAPVAETSAQGVAFVRAARPLNPEREQ